MNLFIVTSFFSCSHSDKAALGAEFVLNYYSHYSCYCFFFFFFLNLLFYQMIIFIRIFINCFKKESLTAIIHTYYNYTRTQHILFTQVFKQDVYLPLGGLGFRQHVSKLINICFVEKTFLYCVNLQNDPFSIPVYKVTK